ncbi:MAG: sugar ABC transporter permease [Hungatella hathewayi]|nr:MULTISPECIES: sugar ABC transporter permease [Hungatella]MCI7383256.1 sugar ABC transporter permease [Hungatella sp.]MDU4971987.1 sugar ABC transporter permease [Hungatella hathewayi]MDY6238430.1 sugar ABC transporter permease [Hungatella hathewayi]
MITPMTIGFLLFSVYPIIWVLRWSFFKYNGYSEPVFVGLGNFIRVFSRDPAYWNSLKNTFLIAGMKMIFEIPLALVLAVLLNNKIKGSSFFRVVFFLPSVFSIAVVGLIFSILFGAYNGIVNAILKNIGLITQNISWFSDKGHAMFVIILVSLWTTFGLNMIYFLMGLQNISKSLYECASIDGANEVQQFFYITMPLVAPILQLVLMLSVLGTMKMTDLILVLTNGAPGGSTEVVMTYIFKYFFSYGESAAMEVQFGYASSMAVVTAVILGIVTLIYLKVSKKMQEVEE